jgi:hypothetical protein
MNVNTRTRSAVAAVSIAATTAIAFPAISTAAPEWDIGAYDHCMETVKQMISEGKIAKGNEVDAYRECCERSGGVFSPNANLYPQRHTASDPKPFTPRDLPSHTLTPVTPLHPGDVTPVFTPTNGAG